MSSTGVVDGIASVLLPAPLSPLINVENAVEVSRELLESAKLVHTNKIKGSLLKITDAAAKIRTEAAVAADADVK